MCFRAMTRARRQCRRIVAFAVLAFAAPALGADSEPAPIDSLRAAAVEGLGRSQVRGASLALIRDGQLVWTESFGVVDQRSSEAATTCPRTSRDGPWAAGTCFAPPRTEFRFSPKGFLLIRQTAPGPSFGSIRTSNTTLPSPPDSNPGSIQATPPSGADISLPWAQRSM